MSNLFTKDDILKAVRDAGKWEEFKKERKKVREKISGFIDDDEYTVAALTVRRMGIVLPGFKSNYLQDKWVKLGKLGDRIGRFADASGVVREIKKGVTRHGEGQSKRDIIITDGKVDVLVTIFGKSLKQFKSEKIQIGDAIKIENAQVLESIIGGKMGAPRLNCGDYTLIKKVSRGEDNE